MIDRVSQKFIDFISVLFITNFLIYLFDKRKQ